MYKNCPACPNERLHSQQYRRLREDLGEVRRRVNGLEATLARGIFLLVANLLGVIVTLGRELIR